MKVKEFLKQFEEMDPEADLYFNMDYGCCADYMDIKEPVFVDQGQLPQYSYVEVRFRAPEFLNSCRKASKAMKTGLTVRAKFFFLVAILASCAGAIASHNYTTLSIPVSLIVVLLIVSTVDSALEEMEKKKKHRRRK